MEFYYFVEIFLYFFYETVDCYFLWKIMKEFTTPGGLPSSFIYIVLVVGKEPRRTEIFLFDGLSCWSDDKQQLGL